MGGGDGNGFNGPTFAPEVVPVEYDRGVRLGEIRRAMRVCLVEGDSERGVISAFQRWRFRKTGVLPAIDPAKVSFKVSSEHWTVRALMGGILIPQARVQLGDETYFVTQQGAEPGAKRLAFERGSERDVTAGPFVTLGYAIEKWRPDAAAAYGETIDDSRIVKGLRLLVPADLKGEGQLAHVMGSDVNAADYADCLRSEIVEGGRAPLARASETSEDCPELRDWKHAKARRFGLEYDERRRAAALLRADFQLGRLDLARLDRCVSGEPDRANFLHTFAAEFFEGTLGELSRLRGSRARGLMRHYQDKFGERELPLFRMTGHVSDEPTPGSYAAGHHRGASSFHLDLTKVGPHDWNVVFLHELAHLLDGDTWNATASYSLDRGRVDEFRAWHEAGKTTIESLSDAERVKLEKWVRAGIGRGLLAEYRAWLATFAVYEEAPWERLPWMSAVPASTPRELFAYLEARAIEPHASNGFELPVVRAVYERERAKLKAGLPEPGELERAVEKALEP